METRILITDLTAMGGDRVCIAGIDREWNAIRPVFSLPDIPIRNDLYMGRQVVIRPGAVVTMQLEPLTNPEAPHVEDHLWSGSHRMRHAGVLDDERWRNALQGLVERSARPLFGAELRALGRQRNRIFLPGEATHSLATVRCRRNLVFRLSEKDGGGFRYALSFFDDRGESYQNIPVTDLALRAWANAQVRQGATTDFISDLLSTQLNEAHHVYLRLGLGREYEGKFWLQVNGIYSFPDWLDGRCFADFDAAPG
ncbi:MAG: hypothetical protein OXP68_05630 [Anaerolineaceae bacterium]|nr:hypothetical protein [Anaerolineaceae bacterium]MDE0327584.1 hypothetical protein [Anaerolineaceae bacterium]